MNIKRIALVAILVLAAILRLYKLGEFPIHLTNDEAGLGYNAYSILQTGRDEHGNLFPVIFKSFGDWKPGLYVYLSVPTIALFGLSEFSVRLPSALMGILAVLYIYKLGSKLFGDKVGLFSALSLALLPWHIHFSRGAWEANVALTLLIGGVYYFLKSFENNKYFVLSALFLSLTLWSYQSAKIASLIVLVGLAFLYHKQLFKIKFKYLVSALILGLLVSLPIVLSLFTGKAGRANVMSVFSYTRSEEYIEETVFAHENITRDSPIFALYHSEALNLFRGISGRYLNYLSGKFLFFEGDWSNPRHTSVDSGYLLYVDIIIFVLGIIGILKRKMSKEVAFVWFLFLVSQVPAALTRDSAHGVRSLGMIFPISLILGYGLNDLVHYLQMNKLAIRLFGFIALVSAFVYSMAIYLDAYYVQNKYLEPKDYFYGYKQVVQKVFERETKYEKIVFSQSYDQPYIFFLFFGAMDGDSRFSAWEYQKESSFEENQWGDVGLIKKLGNIEFRPINWYDDRGLGNTLFIVREEDVSKSDLISKEFNIETVSYPDGKTAFILINKNEINQ